MSYHVRLESSLNGKGFAADLAVVRLLSGVCSKMVSESGRASELLGTQGALIRFISTVRVFVFDEVEGLDASEVALVAFEGFFSCNENDFKLGDSCATPLAQPQ